MKGFYSFQQIQEGQQICRILNLLTSMNLLEMTPTTHSAAAPMKISLTLPFLKVKITPP